MNGCNIHLCIKELGEIDLANIDEKYENYTINSGYVMSLMWKETEEIKLFLLII